jgi:hypothetical protein
MTFPEDPSVALWIVDSAGGAGVSPLVATEGFFRGIVHISAS